MSNNSAYEDWKATCDKADAAVKGFNETEHEPCPLCGSKAEAWWNYDGDYDISFYIECTNCSCRVKESTFEECVDVWEAGRKSHETKTLQEIEGIIMSTFLIPDKEPETVCDRALLEIYKKVEKQLQ